MKYNRLLRSLLLLLLFSVMLLSCASGEKETEIDSYDISQPAEVLLKQVKKNRDTERDTNGRAKTKKQPPAIAPCRKSAFF